MLTEFFAYLRNWFDKARYDGHFKIVDGELQSQYVTCNGKSEKIELLNGQYFRIKDSILNDGVYKYPASDLNDEEFDGAVWSMAVPHSVIKLAEDCMEWQGKYGGASSDALSPFTSESLDGVYSYTKGANSESSSGIGNANDWQNVFAARLALWRKL